MSRRGTKATKLRRAFHAQLYECACVFLKDWFVFLAVLYCTWEYGWIGMERNGAGCMHFSNAWHALCLVQ